MVVRDRNLKRSESLALEANRCNGTGKNEHPTAAIHQVPHQAARTFDVDKHCIALQTTARHCAKVNDHIDTLVVELSQILKRSEITPNP